MPTATISSKGQITIPKEIRDFLKLKQGQEVDFKIAEDRRVILEARNLDVRALKGFFKSPYKKPVTLKEMDESIAEGAAYYRR